jgi:hypothetical protein
MFTNVGSMGRFKKRVSVNFIPDITDGLIGQYLFEEGSGTTFVDNVGSYDLSITGAGSIAWSTNNKEGTYAAEWTGNRPATVQYPAIALRTISFWFRRTTDLSANKIAFVIDSRDSSEHETLRISSGPSYPNGSIEWTVAGTTGGDYATVLSVDAFDATEWQYITCTIENRDINMYLNGVFQSTDSLLPTSTWHGQGELFRLGSRVESARDEFALDDFRYYNRVLDGGEILDLYNFVSQ